VSSLLTNTQKLGGYLGTAAEKKPDALAAAIARETAAMKMAMTGSSVPFTDLYKWFSSEHYDEYEKDIKAYYRKSHGDFPNSLPQTNEATREFFIKHLPQEVRQDVTARYNVKRAAHNQKNKALTASLRTFEKGDGLTPYQRYE
jgi:hypothetical protein